MHIKSALNALNELGKYVGLPMELLEYEHAMGDSKLLKTCEAYSTVPLPGETIQVFIFDRDTEKIVRTVNDGNNFKKWSDRVFSFSIPVPKHRVKTPDISIEFYYRDDEIQRIDSEGRRLFINTEFHTKSQRHNTLDLTCTDRNKVSNDGICIIDNDVFDNNEKNVALSKKKFAQYVLNRTQNFDDFDFSSFCGIFDKLVKILQL
jgi:hypothetical protein